MTAPKTSSADFDVAYLGPAGTFAHLVAQQRYPDKKLIPFRTVPEVFEYVQGSERGKGIVPIENSSGGMILVTVDEIISHALSLRIKEESLRIEEELSIDVQLALMGRRDQEVTTIFSHFAPIHHCEPFLEERYPHVEIVLCPSTSSAAESAAKTPGGAAIGPIVNGEIYGLDVIVYPVRAGVPNVTSFFVVGRDPVPSATAEKTSIVFALVNEAGSLYRFLKPFNDAGVNLTRIASRPIVGHPNDCNFFLEVAGTASDPTVRYALEAARALSTRFCNVGQYPVIPRFQS